MEGSCQLAAEKIAYSANESKSNRDLFQIVSIHFSGLLIAVILEGCQKEKHKGKAPFRGRFPSARIDSEAALFPEFHLQEFLKSFPKLHLELGPGQLLQSLFPPQRGQDWDVTPAATAGLKAGARCCLPPTRNAWFLTFFFFFFWRNVVKKGILCTEATMVTCLIFLNSFQRKGFLIIIMLAKAALELHCRQKVRGKQGNEWNVERAARTRKQCDLWNFYI